MVCHYSCSFFLTSISCNSIHSHEITLPALKNRGDIVKFSTQLKYTLMLVSLRDQTNKDLPTIQIALPISSRIHLEITVQS
ncbi:hypothetical protein M440DRAFT_1106289 [Trichoderma longibrachiatum ATCC 18648]|uniref:Uncharacterized protein n=1 Tax=Trichoderma longibrachiatum ATCC 18648 TaxID=983965 RepID=A0A2T4CEE5_TRILO|nr:hypothetical protein M440DRAFT_1106289 [Trichoderma longibrachiatum ATCC 18648]